MSNFLAKICSSLIMLSFAAGSGAGTATESGECDLTTVPPATTTVTTTATTEGNPWHG